MDMSDGKAAEGRLHAVGVGPGAPDLLTLRAVEALRSADVILAAESPKNGYSLCLGTVGKFLRPGCAIRRLDFPMSKDKAALEAAWRAAAAETAAWLDKGASAAFLTVGDPLCYSTFIYLARELLRQRPESRVEIIPGISSWQAAAAECQLPLGLGDEILSVVPGTLGNEALERAFAAPGPLVVIKAYRNFQHIRACLEKAGRASGSLLVSRVECQGQMITPLLDFPKDGIPPYMSLILCPAEKDGGI